MWSLHGCEYLGAHVWSPPWYLCSVSSCAVGLGFIVEGVCEMPITFRARHREGAAEDQASPRPGYCTADDGSALTADRRCLVCEAAVDVVFVLCASASLCVCVLVCVGVCVCVCVGMCVRCVV